MSIRTDAPSVAEEVRRYLRTGETDPLMTAWPGNLGVRAERSHQDLRRALVKEVLRRTEGLAHPPLPELDVRELTLRKATPMVRGLFPGTEWELVLRLVERSVVFVITANVERLLLGQRWDRTAWTIANLYLASFEAELLSTNAETLLGLSEETTCYLSPTYFSRDDARSDALVHEVAHIFHNCKRTTAGLPATRKRQWLLDLAFEKRETFAYACELYSCVSRQGADRSRRRELADGIVGNLRLTDERVNSRELRDILVEAVTARNGWKAILRRCGKSRV